MVKPAFNTLAIRTLTGIVLLVVVVAAALVSHATFALLLLAVCVGSMRELYAMAERSGITPQKYYGQVLGAFIVAASYAVVGVGVRADLMMPFLAVTLAATFAVFVIELYRKQENPIASIAMTLMGLIYIALPLSLLVFMPILPVGANVYVGEFNGFVPSILYKPWLILAYIFIVWTNDIGAYIFGVAFGKHRLFERISPKKSWEGFLGGLFAALLLGLFMGWLLGDMKNGVLPVLLFWGGLSLVIVVSGVFGDLVESMFKRSVGIKDSGTLMPGHGGFLDRFDALIYSAPFVFLYFIIFA